MALDVINSLIKGTVSGYMKYSDGRVVTLNEWLGKPEGEEINNLVTDRMWLVIASVFLDKHENVVPDNIYIATGTDSTVAKVTDTKLGNEIARVVTTRKYYRPSGSVGRSNIIDITSTFGVGVAVGTLKEFGLFWGSGVSAEANTGDMMNRITLSNGWEKPVDAEFNFTWRLTFGGAV